MAGLKRKSQLFIDTKTLFYLVDSSVRNESFARPLCPYYAFIALQESVLYDVLIKQAAKSFTPYCCNLLSSYICVLLIRVTSLRYNSGSKY